MSFFFFNYLKELGNLRRGSSLGFARPQISKHQNTENKRYH